MFDSESYRPSVVPRFVLPDAKRAFADFIEDFVEDLHGSILSEVDSATLATGRGG